MRTRSVLTGLAVGVVVCAAATIVVVRRLPARSISEATAASATHASSTIHADGRVATRPGKQARIGAEIQGRVKTVHVVEGQAVKQGDLLAELDSREYLAALQEATGSASEARARVRGRKSDLARSKKLVAEGVVPKEDGDRVREEKTAAEGRLIASSAAAQRARVLLAKTRIVSPIAGVVVSRSIEPSETASPGEPLFVVADLTERRIEAEVDEYDIGRVTLGGPATISADGFPGRTWEGIVEEIPSVVQPRRLRPQDPARPTDTAVLLVKVSLPGDSPLKLGQRVSVMFTLASAGGSTSPAEVPKPTTAELEAAASP